MSVRPSVRVYHLPSPLSSDPEEVEPASPRWPQTPSSAEVGLASNTQGEASTQTLSSARGIRAACPRPLGTRPTPELRLRRQSARVAPTGVSEAGVLPISTMLEAQVQLLHQPHRTEGPWSLLPGDSPPRALGDTAPPETSCGTECSFEGQHLFSSDRHFLTHPLSCHLHQM